MRESTIAETFKHFDELDIVIVGIGAILPEVKSMLTRRFTALGVEAVEGFEATGTVEAFERAGIGRREARELLALYAEVGEDAQAWFEALLRQGVIVRPLAGFGAPTAVRITVGTPDEHAFLAQALARLRTTAGAS